MTIIAQQIKKVPDPFYVVCGGKKYLTPFTYGGVLLITLVILGVMVVVIGASVSYVNRQFHEISRQKQEEQVFHVAEAGVNHVLYLLNDGVYNTEQLLALASPIEQTVTDPVTGTDNGIFSLTFASVSGTQPGQAIRATSIAKPDATSDRCQTVIATIRRVTGSGDTPFTVSKWDHVPQCTATYEASQQPPTLTTVDPPDNAPPPDVLLNTNLTMTFSKDVTAVAGKYVYIRNSDGTLAQPAIEVTSGAVSGSGTGTIVVNPPQDLVAGAYYYITVDEGVFVDSLNLPFAGIADNTTWNFRAKPAPLALDTKDPTDGATGVAINKQIQMTFSKTVNAGPGNILIKLLSSGATERTIPASSTSGSGTNVITVPSQNLSYSTDYFINIDNNAFQDDDAQWYEGITDNVSWNFQTEGVPSVTTIEVRIAASSDDAEERDTGLIKLANSDLELVYDFGNQTVGMRFIGIDIPPGATITNAYIQFTVDEFSTTATSLMIQGQADDAPPAFSDASYSISTRPRTSTSVPWSPPAWLTVGESGPDQRTPDLTPIIQEIVNRPGWSSGNALVLVITGTGERVAESYDGVASLAPLLHAEFN